MRRMYSENQVQKLVQEGIDNQEIKLYEDINIEENVVFESSLSDITFTKGFCSIRKTKENELYLVLNFSIKNESASAQTLGNTCKATITLPEEISKNIYDINGDTVDETLALVCGITSGTGYTDRGNSEAGFFDNKVFTILNARLANQIISVIRDIGSVSAGATWNFTFRIFLTL